MMSRGPAGFHGAQESDPADALVGTGNAFPIEKLRQHFGFCFVGRDRYRDLVGRSSRR